LTSDVPNSVVPVAKSHHLALLVIAPDASDWSPQHELDATSQRAGGDRPMNDAVVA